MKGSYPEKFPQNSGNFKPVPWLCCRWTVWLRRVVRVAPRMGQAFEGGLNKKRPRSIPVVC